MGRRAPDARTFKYGQPLFAASWPIGEILYVAGGGGKEGSGVENRIVAARFSDGRLSDEIACVRLKDSVESLAMSPASQLLVASTESGLVTFQVCIEDVPKFIVPQKVVVDALSVLSDQHVKRVRFSQDGSWLALGDAVGQLTLLKSSHLLKHAACQAARSDGEAVREEIKDVDFSPLHANNLLAFTVDDGECYLWQPPASGSASTSKPDLLTVLNKPADMKACILKHCRFQCVTRRELLCSMNYRGRGCIGRWMQSASGEYKYSSRSKLLDSAVTGMDISPDGSMLAVVTSSGGAYTIATATLAIQSRFKAAHMIFGTAVAFARDGHAFVSVSADGSARVHSLPGSGRARCAWVLACLLVLFGVLVGAVLPQMLSPIKES